MCATLLRLVLQLDIEQVIVHNHIPILLAVVFLVGIDAAEPGKLPKHVCDCMCFGKSEL